MPDEVGDRAKSWDLPIAVSQSALVALAAVPIVGGALAQVFGGYPAAVRFKRLQLFGENLASRVAALEARDELDRVYANSDPYANFVIAAAERAAAAHRVEQVELLAEVAAGAARRGASDILREKFLSASDAIGAEHVRVLREFLGGELRLDTRDAFPNARILNVPGLTSDERELLIRDLVAVGFLEDSGMGRFDLTSGEVWQITSTGIRFLDFLVSRAESKDP